MAEDKPLQPSNPTTKPETGARPIRTRPSNPPASRIRRANPARKRQIRTVNEITGIKFPPNARRRGKERREMRGEGSSPCRRWRRWGCAAAARGERTIRVGGWLVAPGR
nr:unnamed protein product [Digitaria exilis]